MKKTAIIFLIGFVVCLLISVPLVAWAVRVEDEDSGIMKESKERLKDMPKVILAAAVISIFWILAIPLYISMLVEKIRGRKDKG